LDGGHFGSYRIHNARSSVAVCCNPLADTLRVLNQGDHLFQAKLGLAGVGVWRETATGCHHLDVVGTGLHLRPDGLLDVLDRVTLDTEEVAVSTGRGQHITTRPDVRGSNNAGSRSFTNGEHDRIQRATVANCGHTGK